MEILCKGLQETQNLKNHPTKADKGKLDDVRISVAASRTEDIRTCEYNICYL